MTFVLTAAFFFALGAFGASTAIHARLHRDLDDLERDRLQLDRDRRDHLAAVELWLQVPEERVCFDLRAHKSLRSVLS